MLIILDTQGEPNVRFENVLYEGGIQDNLVRHENIIVIGYTGLNIQLQGGNYFSTNILQPTTT